MIPASVIVAPGPSATMGFSIFGNDSGRPDAPNRYNFQRNLPVVEQNLSYTRVVKDDTAPNVRPSEGSVKRPRHRSVDSFDNDVPDARVSADQLSGSQNHTGASGISRNFGVSGVAQAGTSGYQPNVAPSNSTLSNSANSHDSDEDSRFLRLAREALVATSTASNLIVDPTIQDLLQRLQYALSPHGNPIRRSESIRANENGQLMIQTFYNGFPNLSNNVFTGTPRDSAPGENEWDFLIDKRAEVASSGSESGESDSHKQGLRKFLCRDCSMSFRRSSDLKRHEKQHLSVPANICPQCGKGFARKDALKRHLGTLTCKRNAEKELYLTNLKYLER